MSIDSAEYARLSKDSYEDRSKWVGSPELLTLKGSNTRYKVLAVENNTETDYQGTAYLRVDTNEVIITHRGTASAKDGMTDVGMVFNGHNDQLNHAMAFTDRAVEIAKAYAKRDGYAASVSITGHSLGGTLAEITAARTGLHAETFNSYGPGALKGLDRYGVDVKAAHPNIVNHVRATDVVGAGGPHLGSTRIYAAPEDIASLKRGRYIGLSPLPANPVLATDFNAHTINNFLPDNKVIRDSALSPVNEANGRAHAAAISHYRNDVMQGRLDLNKAVNREISLGVVLNNARLSMQISETALNAVAAAPGKTALAAGGLAITGAQRAGQALDEATQTIRDNAARVGDKLSRRGSWLSSQADPVAPSLITDPGHPGRPMFAQAQGLLQTINRDRNIPCDQRTDNAAACIAVAARQAGLTRIDHIALNTGAERMFAVQGKPGHHSSKLADVDTVKALHTPIAQSSEAFVVADLQVRQHQALQQQQQEQQRSEQSAQPLRMKL